MINPTILKSFSNALPMAKQFARHIVVAGTFLSFTILVGENVFSISNASGPSMSPTIKPSGQVLFVNKFLPKFFSNHKYEKGDVIIAKSSYKKDFLVCKRIAHLEGETVIVNGEKVEVPKGHVWILGDNEENSIDSRNYGPVPLSLIDGKATHIVWPPKDFGRLEKEVRPSWQTSNSNFLSSTPVYAVSCESSETPTVAEVTS